MNTESIQPNEPSAREDSDDVEPVLPDGEIVAYAGRWYRNARYIMAIICFALAAWFAYDGFVNWPAQNQRFDEMMARQEKPDFARHTDTDLAVQKTLAVTLPFLGIGIIGWLLFNSRGCYRLKDDVLYVPGHPPVPLDAIREIDKKKWEKKGIVYLDYELEGSDKSRTIVLDDFVYDQVPTDKILETIEKSIAPPEAGASGTTVEAPQTDSV
jgi:hypothetical protein